MRIIEPGKVKHGFEGIWACRDCGCRWELTEEDNEPVGYSGDVRDGGYWHMPCPTCQELVSRHDDTANYGLTQIFYEK